VAQQDAGHDEWVNAWAETQAAPKAEPFALALIPPPDAPISPDQLMRDIAEIERVRDTLAAQPAPVFAKAARRLSPWFRRARPMRFRW